ncbi:hypothetical protein CRUP_019124 [Coryphaenoides rupestris]|nr:hypothetical protein CRUP_019124 [Coryphaenoides rupestris]
MATALVRFSRQLAKQRLGLLGRGRCSQTPNPCKAAPCRTAVSTASGAIHPKPDKTSFGLIRMTVVVVPFLYVGTLISKNFAALLEEHDIFVPEDDDDDD